MPYSDPMNKSWTISQIMQLPLIGDPITVVDVGAGAGVYAELLRTSLGDDVHITGIEPWLPYYERFNLLGKYDAMSCRDARWVTNWNYELSIFGDVMEHMQKEEAVAMWERAGQQNSIESPRYGIISIPIIHYPQGEEEGNPYERHVKEDWSVEEVLDTFKWIKSHEVFPVTMTCLAKFPA